MDASAESTVLDDGYYPLPALSVEDYRKLIGQEVGRTDWMRFVRPVPSGSDIRIVFVLKGLEQRGPGQYTRRFLVTVEIRGKDKPALVAEWLTVALVH